MKVYVDTSVVLRVLLKQPDTSSVWGKWESAYVSDLVRTEFYRTIDRLRLQGKVDDRDRTQLTMDFELFWMTCYRIPLSGKILKRASESFPTVIGTLDALHLSSLLLLQASEGFAVHLLTHDQQLARAAIASGVMVEPV